MNTCVYPIAPLGSRTWSCPHEATLALPWSFFPLLPAEVVSNSKVTMHALTCCYILPWAYIPLNARWFCFSCSCCLYNEVFVYFMTSLQCWFGISPCSNMWLHIVFCFWYNHDTTYLICSPGSERTVSLFSDNTGSEQSYACFLDHTCTTFLGSWEWGSWVRRHTNFQLPWLVPACFQSGCSSSPRLHGGGPSLSPVLEVLLVNFWIHKIFSDFKVSDIIF